ncbi:hypothetical protein [Streptomyces sp. NPDC088707]|uniref:hypothetical protein n=1 Tax=Streptomyces sp. NPDC088707 TaxID=3365871 RepID=UPI00382CCFA1
MTMHEAQERNTAGAETLERERIRRFGLALDKLALDPDEAGRIDALNAETLERERIRRFGLALDKLALDPDETARIDTLNAAVHDAGSSLVRPSKTTSASWVLKRVRGSPTTSAGRTTPRLRVRPRSASTPRWWR